MALFKREKKPPKGPAGRWNVVVGEEMCKAWGWFPMFTAHEENCIGCMLCYQICPDFCIDVSVKAAPGATPPLAEAGARS